MCDKRDGKPSPSAAARVAALLIPHVFMFLSDASGNLAPSLICYRFILRSLKLTSNFKLATATDSDTLIFLEVDSLLLVFPLRRALLMDSMRKNNYCVGMRSL